MRGRRRGNVEFPFSETEPFCYHIRSTYAVKHIICDLHPFFQTLYESRDRLISLLNAAVGDSNLPSSSTIPPGSAPLSIHDQRALVTWLCNIDGSIGAASSLKTAPPGTLSLWPSAKVRLYRPSRRLRFDLIALNLQLAHVLR